MQAESAGSVILDWLPTVVGAIFFLIVIVLALVMRSRIGTAATVLTVIGSIIVICTGTLTTLWYEVFLQEVIDDNNMSSSDITTMLDMSSMANTLAALFGVSLLVAAIFTRRPAQQSPAPPVGAQYPS